MRFIRSRRRVASARSAAAVLLAAALLSGMATWAWAVPVRSADSWADTFDSTLGISEFSGTTSSGGSLRLAEADPVDLGEPVPGESTVYSVLSTDLGMHAKDVFCGTGQKGHLVEYDPGELFQEMYEGPSHWGISNSRGQAVTSPVVQTRVTALAQAGALVVGGTHPDGHLFSFDPAAPGSPPSDLGSCPDTSGAVLALAYDTPLVYAGTSGGDVFTYDGSFADLGQPSGADDPVGALLHTAGALYIGSGDGNLYRYSGGGPGAFTDLGSVGGGAIDALTSIGTVIYVGTASGTLFSYDTAAPGAFNDLGQPPGSSGAINALAAGGSSLYAGREDGHVYVYEGGWPADADQGAPPDSSGEPINCLSVGPDGVLYGGTGDDDGAVAGRLFRMSGYEDYGLAPGPSPVTSVTRCANRVLLADQAGELYSFTSPGTFNPLGSPDGSAVNDMDSTTGTTYIGTQAGNLYSFTDGGSIQPVGAPAVLSPVKSVLIHFPFLDVGLEDGRIYRMALGSPFPDTPLATLPGGAMLNDLAWMDSALYIAGYDGAMSESHLYSYDTEFTDHGNDGDASEIYTLAVSGGEVYAGHQSGRLYSFDGAAWSGELGDCGSPVAAMAPGDSGVVCGTDAGTLFIYDSALRDAGSVPGPSAVNCLDQISGYVFGGTAEGRLFSHDDSWLADRGQPVERQIEVFCMEHDPYTGLFYAGTYRNGHFLVIDPDAGTVVDRGRPINGEREIEDIVVASDGTVYGATYGGTSEKHNPAGGHLFEFDPASGAFTDRGRAPGPEESWWISSLVEVVDGPGPDYDIYAATGKVVPGQEGTVFVYDPVTQTSAHLGVPVAGEGTMTMALRGDRVYGATWDPEDASGSTSSVYRFEPGVPFSPEVLGAAPAAPGGSTNNRVVNILLPSGGLIYGAQNNGYLFSFDPDVPYDPVVTGKPFDATSVKPLSGGPGGSLLCGTMAEGGGHVVGYDDEGFQDLAVPGVPFQDGVASLAYEPGSPGIIVCATLGSPTGGPDDRYAARVFTIRGYQAGGGQYAVSTDIKPGVTELDPPVTGHESVGAICPAPQGEMMVYGGTANGETGPGAEFFVYKTGFGVGPDHWTVPGGHKGIGAICLGTDGRVYIGTADAQGGLDAELLRYDPDDPGNIVSLGVVPLAGTKGIFSLAAGTNGNIYIGTGDRWLGAAWDRCHIVEYAPGTGTFTDRGEVGTGPNRLSSLVMGTDGYLYGGAGYVPGTEIPGIQFMKYNISTGNHSESTSGEFGTESSIDAMVVGPDGRLYCGSGPGGRLVSFVFASQTFTWEQSGWPYSGQPVTALTSSDDAVIGCAGSNGNLFRFVPGSGYTDMGLLTYDGVEVACAVTDNLGKQYFGTAGPHPLVRYDPDYRFFWSTVDFTESEPGTTTATVDILNEAGSSTLLADVTDGQDISTVPASNAGIRLRGNLSSVDGVQTPTIDDWGVTWDPWPNIDAVTPAEAYRGDVIYIWGSNFGTVPGTVTVDGAPATPTGFWTEGFISVFVPEAADEGTVNVDIDMGKTADGSFTLLDPPHLDSIDPTSAHVGDVVELHGTGFTDTKEAGDYVSFNGTVAADYPQWSDTLIRVKVPAGATTGAVRVVVDGNESNGRTLTVLSGGNPTVEVTAPADGQSVSGTVAVSATVQAGAAVQKVDFLVDGAVVATDTSAPYGCTWDADSAEDGGRTVSARATDAAARTGSDSVTAYVNHTVPTAATHWYFAEGCTDYGFETWVLIANPGDSATVAQVNFMDEDGETWNRPLDLPPDSRVTLNASEVVGSANISVEVTAYEPVVCERAMYWSGREEGHSSVGATALSREWYFAEGCTDYGFETYLLLGNPGDSDVEATVRYLKEDGTQYETAHTLPAHSRLTVDTVTELGAAEFSIQVESGAPGIVAERAVYYGSRRCGTETIGCPKPSTSWFLSEGSTDWGFETWLLIGRPGTGDATVTATYRKGNGETVQRVYPVKAGSRFTVDLATEVGTADVSTQVVSDVPVVCERAMYWNGRTAGHCTIGSPGSSLTWYLAEGCTDYGFETWLLLDNPWDTEIGAQLMFLKEDGTSVPFSVSLPAHTRVSLDASSYVPGASFSTEITAERPVMCERAMYWSGRSGGTGSIGAR